MVRFFGTWLALGVASVSLWSQTISSVAGNSSWGRAFQVVVDSAGNVYTPDYEKANVYKTDRFGAFTIVAGSGVGGYSGDGGPATAAKLLRPTGVAVAADGSLFIADSGNERIRKVSPSGIISTYAGTGVGGFTGDGGQATAARLNAPFTLALDAAGNLYFVDLSNYRIRRIKADGTISTVAGSGQTRYSGEGGLATASAIYPGWLYVTSDGTIYFTDDGFATNGNQRVRKVSPTGVVTTVAGSGTLGYAGDGGPGTAAVLNTAAGVAADSYGNVYLSDQDNARIRKVAPSGIITTYAGTGKAGLSGDGGPASAAQVSGPSALTLDSEGNLYVVDQAYKTVRKITAPALPTINVTSAAIPSFLGKTAFGSNMYVEIYGSNLSTTTRTWAGGDFQGSNAPKSLDNVSVTVNGKPAFIYFISPGQININTPEDTATGPVSIVVTNSIGTSNAGTATRARVSPTLQSIPQFNIGGKQYVVAQTPDFKSFIGVPGMLNGVTFVRAKPGDTVSLYALGCGVTNPATAPGVVVAQASPLASSFQVKIAGATADVPFGGAVAGAIGLYQFNVVIPNVAAGDQAIELIVDGVSNAQNLVITIGQ